MRLPGCGVVLADPGFGKAELVGPAQGLQIPAMALEEAALRRVRGHRKEAVLHRHSPGFRLRPPHPKRRTAPSHAFAGERAGRIEMYQFVNRLPLYLPFFCRKGGLFSCASLTQLPSPR